MKLELKHSVTQQVILILEKAEITIVEASKIATNTQCDDGSAPTAWLNDEQIQIVIE